MAKGENQKLKYLYLMKILLEKTDEEHSITMQEIISALSAYGVEAERKSVYTDIEELKKYGLDIQREKKNRNYYYHVNKREFQLPELKLLVDAVQSSKFITTQKSEELIKKLEGLASKYQAQKLQRQVYIYNRAKTGNETIYENVDFIHQALSEGYQIAFQYNEWTTRKTLQPRKNGEVYQVSPWALSWDDENYYLLAFDPKREQIRHYRVDKMQKMKIVQLARLGKEQFENFNLAEFSKKTFGMYGGREEKVTLLCKKSLAGVLLDRYGTDLMMIPVGEEEFRTHIPVAVSSQFFGWIAGLGDVCTIVSPKSVKEEYVAYLKNLIKKYEE